MNKHETTKHQKLTKVYNLLERKRNKLRRSDERNKNQEYIISKKINYFIKAIKKISKESSTGQQINLIEKLNQARLVYSLWKTPKTLHNQNQKNNENFPMDNQETADALTEKLKTAMKTDESKTDKAKQHEQIVSLKIRGTNFKATNLCEEGRKHTVVKPATLKSIIRNRKNTAPGPDGTNSQMIKQLSLETIKILAQATQKSIHLGHIPNQPNGKQHLYH